MFPHSLRLPGHKILTLIKSRHAFFSPFFTLKTNPKANNGVQIGIVVSTKISKKAVIRNHLRRLIREALRPTLTRLPKNQELLFIARPQILGKKLPAIITDILCLLQKAQPLN